MGFITSKGYLTIYQVKCWNAKLFTSDLTLNTKFFIILEITAANKSDICSYTVTGSNEVPQVVSTDYYNHYQSST